MEVSHIRSFGLALLLALLLLTAHSCAETLITVRSTAPTVPPLIQAGGSFGLARASDGSIWGWGDNARGQLGNGTTLRVRVPSPAAVTLDGKEIADIACGNVASLFLMADGTVYSCGGNNYGQQAQPQQVSVVKTPVQIPELNDIVQIASGFGQCLALDAEGNVYAWGRNSNGQLGLGDKKNRHTPEKLALSDIVSIQCGGKYCMAMDRENVIYGWGDNEYGQLGNTGNARNLLRPEILSFSGQFSVIACGGDTAYGLDYDGKLYAWGRNDYYQLGNPNIGKMTSTPVPVALPDKVKIAKIQAYNAHVGVITQEGALWQWGSVYHGQVGNGLTKSKALPQAACPENGVTLFDVGSLQSYFVSVDGEVFGAGCNEYSQSGAFKWRSDYYVREWKDTGLNLQTGTWQDPKND